MRIRTKVMAVVLIAVLALTGCVEGNVDIVINSDGSGVMSTTVSYEKEALIEYMEEMYTSMNMKLTEKDLKELDSELQKEGYKIVTIDGKEYYQMNQTENIKKGELQKTFGTEDGSYVTTDIVYLVLDLDIKKEMKEMKELGLGDIPTDSVKYTVTVQLPNPIVRTNGTIDEANPNKASFTLPLDKKSTIFATTNDSVTVDSVKAMVKKLNTVKAPKITKLKPNRAKGRAKKATATLKFKKVKGAYKYEIQYSTKKSFKGAMDKLTKKNVYTLKGLKTKKKYYVRVRALMKNYADVTVYSDWVKKTVKTKR
ncbi:MAG: hypothetical protein J1F02_11585 [Lachnospiraceae bacterium]|nr:hypothetical protein [Lachnospiraceae bacterium]